MAVREAVSLIKESLGSLLNLNLYDFLSTEHKKDILMKVVNRTMKTPIYIYPFALVLQQKWTTLLFQQTSLRNEDRKKEHVGGVGVQKEK